MSLSRFLSFLVLSCTTAFSTSRIDLNSDWRFHLDPAKSGEAQRWFHQVPTDVEIVDLPHTWNIGPNVNYQGTAWYFKAFTWAPAKGQHVEIHFGATFYKSRVWLNGNLVGEHEGGYTEYHLDLTPQLKENNLLAVEINNEPKVDTIPGADLKAAPNGTIADWWPYGGIVRGAWLTVNNGTTVRWQHIDTKPSSSTAEVTVHVEVENQTSALQSGKLKAVIFADGTSAPVTSVEKEVRLRVGSAILDCSLKIPDAKLWSIDNPHLYRSEVTLLDRGGRVLDSRSDNFGVRTVEIRDRHLYLNGERVRLTGLTRHEDSPWEGLAETRGTMLHDWEDLKNLHTTLTRPVHYPQHPFIYDYADRHGILLVPEIPMWQFAESQMTNPRVIALAKQELHDLIEQNYNHPSIFAWSVENESATDTPGGVAYFQTMYAYAKQLDPHRYVSFADDMVAFANPATNGSRYADFIMWNEYFGSWDGPETLLPAALAKIRDGYPDKMVLVTEFGYPGVFATDPQTADKERSRIIREHLDAFARQDWIGGALLWCYQDYHSSHNLRPGQTDGYVDHGVVDKNRQRRPSYYVWQEANAPAHLHLRWTVDEKGIPTGFEATIARRSEQELPSYSLVNYRVEWSLLDQNLKEVAKDSQALQEIGPPQALQGHWSHSDSQTLRLDVTLYRPGGDIALRKIVHWHLPKEGTLGGDDQGGTIHPASN